MKLLFSFFFILISNISWAQSPKVQIDINQAKARKTLVAFPALQFSGNTSASPNYQSVGAELFRTVINDLSISTYFQFIAQTAFLEDTTKTSIRPAPEAGGFKFESWKQIGAEFLIRGSFSLAGNNISLEIYAYNVAKGNSVLGKKYKGPTSAVRRIAHTFSNDLLEALTGQKGMFLSRVVTTSDRAGGQAKEVYIMDWDATNIEKITNLQTISVSPAWSPDATKVAYTASVGRKKSKTRNWDLWLYDMVKDKRWLVSYRQGINSGAAFSPDGEYIYLTITQGGLSDIFKIDLSGEIQKKLTNGPRGALNVEPAISPDGKKIAFSSDRSGKTMIYVMNADGSNPNRITFAGNYNATPAWSPDGKKIAFSGFEKDHFDIFVMNTDGSEMVRITSARKPNGRWATNEDPVFSPDGRHLMYTSNRTGSNQIYISNLDGSEERRMTNDGHNYFKPKWSNNIE